MVSVDTVSVEGVSDGVSVVSDPVVTGDEEVETFSPLQDTGKVDGQFGSLGWKHASVWVEFVQ